MTTEQTILNNFKIGDGVFVNLGHRIVYGIVVEYNNNEFVTVKHDNFKGEVFHTHQIIAKEND